MDDNIIHHDNMKYSIGECITKKHKNDNDKSNGNQYHGLGQVKNVVLSQLQRPKLKPPLLISRRPIKLPQQRLPNTDHLQQVADYVRGST